jgi:hypothetical protein
VLQRRQAEIWDTLDPATQETYGKEYIDAIYSHLQTVSANFNPDLTSAVRSIRSALLSMRPRARYTTGKGEELFVCLYPLLPVWLADTVMATLGLLPRHMKPAALL